SNDQIQGGDEGRRIGHRVVGCPPTQIGEFESTSHRFKLIATGTLLDGDESYSGHRSETAESFESNRPRVVSAALWVPLPGNPDAEAVGSVQLLAPVVDARAVSGEVWVRTGDVLRPARSKQSRQAEQQGVIVERRPFLAARKERVNPATGLCKFHELRLHFRDH